MKPDMTPWTKCILILRKHEKEKGRGMFFKELKEAAGLDDREMSISLSKMHDLNVINEFDLPMVQREDGKWAKMIVTLEWSRPMTDDAIKHMLKEMEAKGYDVEEIS